MINLSKRQSCAIFVLWCFWQICNWICLKKASFTGVTNPSHNKWNYCFYGGIESLLKHVFKKETEKLNKNTWHSIYKLYVIHVFHCPLFRSSIRNSGCFVKLVETQDGQRILSFARLWSQQTWSFFGNIPPHLSNSLKWTLKFNFSDSSNTSQMP